MLDAPVSGGVGGAEAGTLTFMVGGSDGGLRQRRPILQAMGSASSTPAAGDGQAAKICNNMMLGISMIGGREAFVLAEQLGLDAQTLFEIGAAILRPVLGDDQLLPGAGPGADVARNRDYRPGFTAAMMLKDLKLAQQPPQISGATHR